jgi:Ca2+-binding RTX toxin-like protein
MANLTGSELGETLTGTSARDRILGLGGNDNLAGEGGGDFLDGDAGQDSVSGGEGDDTIAGGAYLPLVSGEDNDVIDGGAGSDWVTYETLDASLNPSLDVRLDDGLSYISYGLGTGAYALQTDVLVNIENAIGFKNGSSFYGNDADNTFIGIGHFDSFHSSAGNDTYLVKGGGIASLAFDEDPAGIILNAQKGVVLDGFGDEDHFRSIGIISGSSFDDVIVGGKRGENLSGRDGDDRINGGKGNDFVIGGPGNDHLDGGRGGDWLTLDEGWIIDLSEGTATGLNDEVDILLNIENVILFESGTVIGGDQANRFVSSGGGSTVTGGGGKDRFATWGGDNFFDPDVIMDFEKGVDKIEIEKRFSNLFVDADLPDLPLGTLPEDLFAIGAATDADDYFVFDTDTNTLAFDPNGSDPGVAFEFIIFANDVDISAGDIVIVDSLEVFSFA